MAISAYKNKKIQSILKTANTFSISEATLRARLKERKSRAETRANSHIITEFEEESLLQRLLDTDKYRFPIRPEFLRGMAEILFCDHLQNPTATIGINWPYKFIKHYPEIYTQYTRQITYQHAKQEDPKIIIPWFQTVQAAIQEHGIHEDNIWNFDKIGFAIGLCSSSKIITAIERSERPYKVIQGNRK